MEVQSSIRGFGQCRLDLDRKILWANGEPVDLPLKAVELLCVLVERRGAVVSKEEIWRDVWNDAFVEETNLTHYIYRLRKAFRDIGDGEIIKTVPRRGYRFARPVSELPDGEIVIDKHAITRTTIEIEDEQSVNVHSIIGTLTGSPWKLVLSTLIASFLIVGIGAWKFGAASSSAASNSAIHNLAVLPFRTIDKGDRSRHDGLGLADDLITRLSNIREINVRPTSAVAGFENSEANSVDIGRKLAVDSVLEGTVFRIGDKVRVTMRLLNIAGNKPIWSGQFERTGDDKMLLMDEIAANAVDALSLNLSDGEKTAVKTRVTDDDEAYQLYQKGRFEWNKRSWQGEIEAERLFRNAIDRDPKFALAYVGLADRLATESDGTEAYSVIDRALEIDPNLGEAHATLGFLKMFHEWDWAGAETEFKRSIELAPGYATAHHWYATLLVIEGRKAEAEAEFERALAINPLSFNFLGDLGQAYYFDHEYGKAAEYCQKALEIYPDFVFAHAYLADVDLLSGNYDGAVSEYLKADKIDQTIPNTSEKRDREMKMHLEERLAKYRVDGVKWFLSDRIDPSGNPVVALSNAKFYAFLGENSKALDNLEQAVNSHAFTIVFLKVDPMFDKLHDEPRFKAILKQLNL